MSSLHICYLTGMFSASSPLQPRAGRGGRSGNRGREVIATKPTSGQGHWLAGRITHSILKSGPRPGSPGRWARAAVGAPRGSALCPAARPGRASLRDRWGCLIGQGRCSRAASQCPQTLSQSGALLDPIETVDTVKVLLLPVSTALMTVLFTKIAIGLCDTAIGCVLAGEALIGAAASRTATYLSAIGAAKYLQYRWHEMTSCGESHE